MKIAFLETVSDFTRQFIAIAIFLSMSAATLAEETTKPETEFLKSDDWSEVSFDSVGPDRMAVTISSKGGEGIFIRQGYWEFAVNYRDVEAFHYEALSEDSGKFWVGFTKDSHLYREDPLIVLGEIRKSTWDELIKRHSPYYTFKATK